MKMVSVLAMLRRNIPACILVVFFLGCILFLNWTYSFSSDDCAYALKTINCTDTIPHHLGTIGNAFIENCLDGHRPVVHLFVRIFTGCFDKWVFDIANTCMLGCLVACIFVMTKKKVSFNALVLVLSLVFFILCKGESYLWCAGSLNYLWAGVGGLLFCTLLERVGYKSVPMVAFSMCCIFSILAGWLQEACVLPITCAMVAYYVFRRRLVSKSQIILFGFYVLGCMLLVQEASGRLSTVEAFSIQGQLMVFIKIALAVKGVWLLLGVFALCRDKRGFVSRNLFCLFVIFASICMISIIGFNGERSLYAANLFSIVVLVKEVNLSNRLSKSLSLLLVATLCVCCYLGSKIKQEFDAFTAQYLASEQGLCVHNRVECGPFARFFHQAIYTWAEVGHGQSYAYYHNRSISPVALYGSEYSALVADTYCAPSNRLSNISIEAYTLPDSNTIVVPWKETLPTPISVKVKYNYPNNILSRIKKEIAMRKRPLIVPQELPRRVKIKDCFYLFVSKIPESDSYIKGIEFSY